MTALGSGRVFISHSADDAAIASQICAAIEARGIRCWIAPRNVRAGDDFLESIQAAIESAPAFVLVLSRASSVSPFVLSETQVAFDYKRPIFPVRIEKVDPRGSLRMLLSRWHRVDAIGPGRQSGIARLAEAVSRRVAAGTGARDTRGSGHGAGDGEGIDRGRRRNWPALVAIAASAAAILLLVLALATAGGPAGTDSPAPPASNGAAETLEVAAGPAPARIDQDAVTGGIVKDIEDIAASAATNVLTNFQNETMQIPDPVYTNLADMNGM